MIPSFSLADQERTPLLQAESSLKKEANEEGINATGSLKSQLPSTVIPRSHHNEVGALVTASKTIPEQRNMPSAASNQMRPIQNQAVTAGHQKLRNFFSDLTRKTSEQGSLDVSKTVKELVQGVVVSGILCGSVFSVFPKAWLYIYIFSVTSPRKTIWPLCCFIRYSSFNHFPGGELDCRHASYENT